MVLGSSPVAVTSPSDFAPASSKEFLDIQAIIECGFTLKRIRDMTEHTVKIGVDKGTKFCNRSMKSWLEKNDTEMYSTNNEGNFFFC